MTLEIIDFYDGRPAAIPVVEPKEVQLRRPEPRPQKIQPKNHPAQVKAESVIRIIAATISGKYPLGNLRPWLSPEVMKTIAMLRKHRAIEITRVIAQPYPNRIISNAGCIIDGKVGSIIFTLSYIDRVWRLTELKVSASITQQLPKAG